MTFVQKLLTGSLGQTRRIKFPRLTLTIRACARTAIRFGIALKIGFGLVFVLIVSLFVTIVVVVSSTNVNQYKGLIAQTVKEATGRNLRIKGDLHFAPSLMPKVVVEGVSFANAPWGLRPQMLTVKRFEAKVALLPLTRGEFRVKRLVLIEPEILVETDAKGRSNWDDFVLKTTQEHKQQAKAVNGTAPVLDIGEVQIERGRLKFRDGVSGQTIKLRIKDFSARADSFDDPIALDLAANFKGHPFDMAGTLGALNRLVKNESFPVKLAVKKGRVKVNVDGSVTRPMEGKGLNLALKITAKSLGDLPGLAGTDFSVLGPVRITAKLSDKKRAYMVKDLKATVGKSDLSGKVTVAGDGRRSKVSARLSSTLIDLTDVPPTNPLPLLKALLSADAEGTFKANHIHAPGMSLNQVGAALNPKSGQQRANLALTMKADSLADLSRLAGTDLPAFGPFWITAKVEEEKGAFTVKDFKATIGNSDLSGKVTVAGGGRRPRVSARLSASLIDLADFTPASNGAPKKKSSDEKLIFPQYPLPLDVLHSADGEVTLKAKHVRAQGMALKQVNVALNLKDGRLRVKHAKAQLAGGTVSADMTLNASGRTAKLSTHLDAKQVEMGRLLEKVKMKNVMSGGRTNVMIDLEGRGNSVRALMSKLDGRMLVAVGEGRIHNSVVNIAAPDLVIELMHMINPFAERDEYTSLRCGVVLFDVKDGIAMSDNGISAETSKMNLIASGTINLGTEELDLSIHPEAHQGISVNAVSLSNLVRVGGTLAEPKPQPDPVGILKTSASIGAAVATNGLSLLAELLFNVVTADRSPCITPLRNASARAPDDVLYQPASSQQETDEDDRRTQLEEIFE